MAPAPAESPPASAPRSAAASEPTRPPAQCATGRRRGRQQIGHWEIDTVLGRGSQACMVTMVERATNFVAIGAMAARTATAFADRTLALIARQSRRVRTITADNGTEVTGYRRIERLTGSQFYFAAPYRSWERAINENMNGLIREYLPKGRSLAGLTQHDCNRIARELNQRPRKRLGFRTPEECYGIG